MIGLAMTNTVPGVVAPGSAVPAVGTNPLAVAVPAGRHPPFVLDMATSAVAAGRLDIATRSGSTVIPEGWLVDSRGVPVTDVTRRKRGEGGLVPLGGRPETGSYKGFGLALVVDILCGVLSGSAFGTEVNNLSRPTESDDVAAGDAVAAPRVGHFFAAVDIGRFMELDVFQARMDQFIDGLKSAPKALDHSEIFVHGEKEYIRTELHLKSGIPLADNVFDTLKRIADDCGIDPPPTVADLVADAAAASTKQPAA